MVRKRWLIRSEPVLYTNINSRFHLIQYVLYRLFCSEVPFFSTSIIIFNISYIYFSYFLLSIVINLFAIIFGFTFPFNIIFFYLFNLFLFVIFADICSFIYVCPCAFELKVSPPPHSILRGGTTSAAYRAYLSTPFTCIHAYIFVHIYEYMYVNKYAITSARRRLCEQQPRGCHCRLAAIAKCSHFYSSHRRTSTHVLR